MQKGDTFYSEDNELCTIKIIEDDKKLKMLNLENDIIIYGFMSTNDIFKFLIEKKYYKKR